MKRNLKNSCFVVLGFLLVWNLLSCNNIFIFKKTTQVSFNLNIQGLQVAHQKQSSALNNRAAGGDVSQVIISLYQATDPASISENQQLDTSKLKHLESITPAVAPDGKVLATFNEVTVGITAVIFVEIYETDPADASQNLAYKGNSKIFTVQEGENNVEIELTYFLNQYTVQFVLNGGSFTESGKETSLSVPSGTGVVLKNYQVERSGYEFGGWYYDDAFNTPVDGSGIVTPTQANITLYAKWEAVNNSITSFADLQSAITSASETIHVAGDFVISDTLTISSATTIIADATTAFTRATGFTGTLFTNSAEFTLQGSENARITINGNDIEASAPAIQSTANLTLTYCNFENNINTSTDGGAIFVKTTAEVTLSASNCNFTNNKVTVSVTAGGAVAIDGSKVNSTITKSNFINNSAERNGGGALYINGSSTTNYLHTIKDCQFNENKTKLYTSNFGGAIYLSQGSLELNNISMNDNRHYSSEDSYSSSDIFIYKNYTNVTLCGTIIINSLVDNFGSGTDNPVIKLENFSTESQIGVLCTAGTGASVGDGDPLITPNDGEKLTPEQIACFTSIEDSNGVQYTLNPDGTISPKS
ncbi:MAG: InlB B-repeat-containing protein [Treponema sp.]|nr:InlB B-repeat-containing protein [Treponema sp.]